MRMGVRVREGLRLGAGLSETHNALWLNDVDIGVCFPSKACLVDSLCEHCTLIVAERAVAT